MKLFPLILLIAFLLPSCWWFISKDCNVPYTYYELVIPVSLSPALDSFRIGDTITISSVFSDDIYERNTGDTYTLQNFSFFPLAEIVNMDSATGVTATEQFDILVDPEYNFKIFNYSDGQSSLLGQHNYENNQYSLEYKLIPKEKGLYLLGHGSGLYGLKNQQSFDGPCEGMPVRVITQMNEGADNNVDFLLNGLNDVYEIIWKRKDFKFYDAGGYCFYVVE